MKPVESNQCWDKESGEDMIGATSVWEFKTDVDIILCLQRDAIYMAAIEKVSSYVINCLLNYDGKKIFPKWTITLESLWLFLYSIISESSIQLSISEEEMKKIHAYLTAKNWEIISSEEALERLKFAVVLWILDTLTWYVLHINSWLQKSKILDLIFLSMMVPKINISKTTLKFLTKGWDFTEEDFITPLRRILMTDFQRPSMDIPSACPFSKSPIKKEWIETIWNLIETKIYPLLQILRNSDGNLIHDFYTWKKN